MVFIIGHESYDREKAVHKVVIKITSSHSLISVCGLPLTISNVPSYPASSLNLTGLIRGFQIFYMDIFHEGDIQWWNTLCKEASPGIGAPLQSPTDELHYFHAWI